HRRAGSGALMRELKDGERPVWHGPKLVTRCRPFHGVACGVRPSPVLLRPAGTRARQLKAKEFIYLLGLKPKPKTFGFVIEATDLPREGRIEVARWLHPGAYPIAPLQVQARSEEHTSELQSRSDLVCRLLLEKKK